MRKAKWLLLVAVGILMVIPGCKSMNPMLQSDVNIATVTPVQFDLMAGQNIDVGYVRVWNDADYLYIQYKVEEPNWYLSMVQAHWATEFALIPQNKQGNPQIGQFMYQMPFDPYVTEHTIQVELTWDWETQLAIATHANLVKVVDGIIVQTETGWAGDQDFPGGSWAKWFWYTIGEPPPQEWHTETAWAGDIEYPGNNWAVVFQHTLGQTTTAIMWAGQFYNCGLVTVTDNVVNNAGEISVIVDTDDDWNMSHCAMHIASSLGGIPHSEGGPIPGHFDYQSPEWLAPYRDADTFVVTYNADWGTQPYVAVHANVGTYVWPQTPDR